MGRWERSKQLAGASWQVLKMDKELMVLPLISGIASLVIGASFLVPVVLTARSTDAFGNDTTQLGPVQYVLLGAMYLALAYVTIFFRTALLCAADDRLRGGNPDLGSALAGAGKRAGKILPWAVVSATVSLVLRQLQERSGLLGRIVVGLVGMAWAVVTFLVLPIIAFEGVGVGQAVKRSTELLKRTWGENLIVNGGIGLISFLLVLPAIAVAVLLAVAGGTTGLIVGIAVAAVWIIAVTCWSNAMSGIFQAALYRYATDGTAPGPFATVDLGRAFTPRGGGPRGFGGGRPSGWTAPPAGGPWSPPGVGGPTNPGAHGWGQPTPPARPAPGAWTPPPPPPPAGGSPWPAPPPER